MIINTISRPWKAGPTTKMVSSITGLISKVQYLALRFQIVLFWGWKITNKWHWLKNKNLKWRKSPSFFFSFFQKQVATFRPFFIFFGESVTIGLSIGYTFNVAVQKLWPIKSKYVSLEGLAVVATLQNCKTKQHWFQSLLDKPCLKFICTLLSPPLN